MAQLKVGELGPHVQRGVAHVRVVVGLHALVALAAQRCGIARGAVRSGGVGAAGHRAIGADADLLALHFVHWVDANGFQELAALLNAAFQLLLHGRRDGEHLRGRLHAVERGELGEVGGKVLAGGVLHDLSVGFVSGLRCLALRAVVLVSSRPARCLRCQWLRVVRWGCRLAC